MNSLKMFLQEFPLLFSRVKDNAGGYNEKGCIIASCDDVCFFSIFAGDKNIVDYLLLL